MKLYNLTCVISAVVGNCSVRENPPTAIGYKDFTVRYQGYEYELNSCTTAYNSVYEVHVVGIYGDDKFNTYEVSVRPRGPVTKPVILVLTSFLTTHWKIDTPINLYRVFYSVSSTVQFPKIKDILHKIHY